VTDSDRQGSRKVILAIDFDGTLTKGYDCMELQEYAKEALTIFHEMGCEMILWTCRDGKSLDKAKEFLKEQGLLGFFSKINEGSENSLYPDTRKILADFYIDDRNLWGFRGWKEAVMEIKKKTYPGGKTREKIIADMCFTYRHDFGIRKEKDGIESGVTEREANDIWKKMAQIYDNDISPLLKSKEN